VGEGGGGGEWATDTMSRNLLGRAAGKALLGEGGKDEKGKEGGHTSNLDSFVHRKGREIRNPQTGKTIFSGEKRGLKVKPPLKRAL